MALTLTAVTMRDAAYPSSVEPAEAAELIYMGGDTPNPVTPASSTCRYKVPCWVRSNPWAVTPDSDAAAFIGLLQRYGVPKGVVVILDLETAVHPAWVTRFGQLLNAAGYLVWPYGSSGFLFANPPLDGYFVSEPDQHPHLDPRSAGTQWGFFGAFDLSIIAAGESLWDTAPTPTPPPAPPTNVGPAYPLKGQTPKMIVPWSTTTGNDGTAYVPIKIPAGCTRLHGGFADVLDPTANAEHHDGDVTAGNPGGVQCAPTVAGPAGPRLRITGGIPDHYYTGRAECC